KGSSAAANGSPGLRGALSRAAPVIKKSRHPCPWVIPPSLAKEQFEHAHPCDRFGLGVRGDRDRLLARACRLAAERFSRVRSGLAARAPQAWSRRGRRRRRAFRHRVVRRAIPRVRERPVPWANVIPPSTG